MYIYYVYIYIYVYTLYISTCMLYIYIYIEREIPPHDHKQAEQGSRTRLEPMPHDVTPTPNLPTNIVPTNIYIYIYREREMYACMHVCIYIYTYVSAPESTRHACRGCLRVRVRSISLLTLSLLTFLDSNFPGSPLWAWEFHPLNSRLCLSQTL